MIERHCSARKPDRLPSISDRWTIADTVLSMLSLVICLTLVPIVLWVIENSLTGGAPPPAGPHG